MLTARKTDKKTLLCHWREEKVPSMAEHLVTVALFTMGQLKPVFLSDSSEKGRILSVKSAPGGSGTVAVEEERVPLSENQ